MLLLFPEVAACPRACRDVELFDEALSLLFLDAAYTEPTMTAVEPSRANVKKTTLHFPNHRLFRERGAPSSLSAEEFQISRRILLPLPALPVESYGCGDMCVKINTRESKVETLSNNESRMWLFSLVWHQVCLAGFFTHVFLCGNETPTPMKLGRQKQKLGNSLIRNSPINV